MDQYHLFASLCFRRHLVVEGHLYVFRSIGSPSSMGVDKLGRLSEELLKNDVEQHHVKKLALISFDH